MDVKDEIIVAEDAGVLLMHADALRQMTWGQWLQLLAYADIGAIAGYTSTGNTVGALLGALVGIVGHLVPLMQTSPRDKALGKR